MFVRMKSSCFITNIAQFFLFYVENALKMRKMRTLKNYADPHHRILSDALPQDDPCLMYTCTSAQKSYHDL